MLKTSLLLFYYGVFLDGYMLFIPENRPFFGVENVFISLVFRVKIYVLFHYLLLKGFYLHSLLELLDFFIKIISVHFLKFSKFGYINCTIV